MNARHTISLLTLCLASVSALQAQEVIQPLLEKGGARLGNGIDPIPLYITDVNGTAYFNSGEFLSDARINWITRTNGTQATTERILGTPDGGDRLYDFDGTLILVENYFDYGDGSFYASLIAYPGGTIKSFGKDTRIGELTVADGSMFFYLDAGAAQLWKSDGTEAGTVLVRDLPASAEQLVALHDVLFFEVTDGLARRLWTSDGTEAGTLPLLDNQGRAIITPTQLTAVGSTLFFAADDPDQPARRALWKSDGTSTGTTVVQGGFPTDAGFDAFTAAGNTLFFSVDDGTHGQELWKSDGTAVGTVLVKDLVPGPEGSRPTELTLVSGTLYFATTDPTGRALWRSDGTETGTTLVKDGFLAEGPLAELTDFDGTLYFIANDGMHGSELWKSDGTPGGTRLVEDLVPGPASAFNADEGGLKSGPGNLTVSGGKLYFAIGDRRNYSIWVLWPLPGLAGYWPLDEAAASTPDASGHGLDAALIGDPTQGDPYAFFDGHSLAFDGQDDFAAVPSNETLNLTNSLTLMGWFRHNSTGGADTTGIEKQGAYRLYVQEAGRLASSWAFDLWNASGTRFHLETPVPVYNDLWHHLAATYDGQAMKLYLDGELVAGRAASGTIGTTSLPLEIGRGDGANYYAGQMDEIRLYERALVQEEIQYLLRGLVVQSCFTAEPASGPAPLMVTFDASCTFNPYDLPIRYYFWYWDDTDEINANGETVSHVFEQPGHYTVVLKNGPGNNGPVDPQDEVRLTIDAMRMVEVTGGPPVSTGPVAAWPLNGTTTDEVNGLNAILVGGPNFVPGPSGQALRFDGQNDYAAVKNHPKLNPTEGITLAAWLLREYGSTGGTGLEKPRSYRLLSAQASPTTARWFFDFWNTAGTYYRVTANTAVQNQTWHHVAATYDGNTVKLYIDGKLDNSEPAGGLIRVAATNLELARRDLSKYFKGKIDEVRLYDRALSAEEVAVLYAGEAAQAAMMGETAALTMAEDVPDEFALEGNYPNPFNPTTTIRYALAEAAPVTLQVYDVLGRRVAVLVEATQEAGRYEAVWDGHGEAGELVAGGVYVLRLRAGSFEAVRTMVLVK